MTGVGMSHDVRAVADAILYEGYLLYPYRANSGKNQSRWQFGVLGPPGAADAGVGEEPVMSAQCILGSSASAVSDAGDVAMTLRFLHLVRRNVERVDADGDWYRVDRLTFAENEWISWDEASEREIELGPWTVAELIAGQDTPVELSFDVPGHVETEPILDSGGRQLGRMVRTSAALTGRAELRASESESVPGSVVLSVSVQNTTESQHLDKHCASAGSMLGAHFILYCTAPSFVSLFDAQDTRDLVQYRCYPVLAGIENPELPGRSASVLVSPIILYDFPRIAEQSGGSMFDCTEIDEILALRVLTMTDEEKAQARATDPKAAQLIDYCEALPPEGFAALHGVLRDPFSGTSEAGNLIPEVPGGVDWWSPQADTAVSPNTDAILVNGIRIAGGSIVRIHPSRRADAQDLFFDGRTARVATIHEDVDGDIHVGVTLLDDPAADLHDWYGRYLYFAPDEVEPLADTAVQREREEKKL